MFGPHPCSFQLSAINIAILSSKPAYALAERQPIWSLAQQFRPATRQELNQRTRKATTATGEGGKISPPPPRALPECGRQPAAFRGQGEQSEQSDNGGLTPAILKLSPPPTQDAGDDSHDARNAQRQSQSEARSVDGRPIVVVTDTHRAQNYGVKADDHENVHAAEAAALGRSEFMHRPVQEGAKPTTSCDDRPCDHYQRHGVLNNRKHYGQRVSSGRHDDSASSSPVNTMAYHVAGCMCELCRRERSRLELEPPGQPTFKVVGVEPRLVSATLEAHRFKRHTRGLTDRGAQRATWRVLWSTQHLRYCRRFLVVLLCLPSDNVQHHQR